MGTFSTRMRAVATRLITKLGDPCTLTKVTKGQYDPDLGTTGEAKEDFASYSAQVSKVSQSFGDAGFNTNLVGFDDTSVVVPWIGEEIDETWEYNGSNITSVSSVSSQGNIVIYTLGIGEK